MCYAMVGIPLGLVMFQSIGERVNQLSRLVAEINVNSVDAVFVLLEHRLLFRYAFSTVIIIKISYLYDINTHIITLHPLILTSATSSD